MQEGAWPAGPEPGLKEALKRACAGQKREQGNRNSRAAACPEEVQGKCGLFLCMGRARFMVVLFGHGVVPESGKGWAGFPQSCLARREFRGAGGAPASSLGPQGARGDRASSSGASALGGEGNPWSCSPQGFTPQIFFFPLLFSALLVLTCFVCLLISVYKV